MVPKTSLFVLITPTWDTLVSAGASEVGVARGAPLALASEATDAVAAIEKSLRSKLDTAGITMMT